MKFSDYDLYFDHVYTHKRQISDYLKETVFGDVDSMECNYDVLTPFFNGKEWAYEYMLKYQPRTAKILLDGSDFRIYSKHVNMRESMVLTQEINGQIILIARRFWGANPDDPGYAGRLAKINKNLTKNWGKPMKKDERHLSLPEALRMAYYYRIEGLGIPDSIATGCPPRLLPFPLSGSWLPIDRYLGNLRLKKKYLPLVEEMIPGIKPDDKDMPYINFMQFLSTSTSNTKVGDVFFIKNHIQDGVVYYIRDADVANMMILTDPAEAIDRYCEHILLRKESRFDFLPWATSFK